MNKREFNQLARIVYQNMPDSENGTQAMHKIREAYHGLRLAYLDLLATHLLHLVRVGNCDTGANPAHFTASLCIPQSLLSNDNIAMAFAIEVAEEMMDKHNPKNIKLVSIGILSGEIIAEFQYQDIPEDLNS